MSLSDYVDVLWRSRILIVVLTIVSGTAGLVAFMSRPRSFTAAALVNVAGAGGDATSKMMAARVLLTSETIAQRIVRDLKLDQPPHEVTATSFVTDRLGVDFLGGTTMLRVHVTLDDPTLATRVVERLVAEAGKLARQASAQERQQLKSELDLARARRDEFAALVVERKREAQLDVLHGELEDLLEQRSRNRARAITDAATARANEIYDRETDIANAESELAVARDVYGALLRRYEELRLGLTPGSVALVQVNPAVVQEVPRAARTALGTAVAALLGCAAAVAFAFIRDYAVRLSQGRSRSKSPDCRSLI